MKNRATVQDELETLWYFHGQMIQRFLIGDAIAVVVLCVFARSTAPYLPALAFPCLSLINFWFTSRDHRKIHTELALGLLIAAVWSVFIAFVSLGSQPTHGLSRGQVNMNEWMGYIFLAAMVIVTISTSVGTYVLWSMSEMESQIRRSKTNRNR